MSKVSFSPDTASILMNGRYIRRKMMKSDAQLVEETLEGKISSFGILVRRYRKPFTDWLIAWFRTSLKLRIWLKKLSFRHTRNYT
jgi:hypothetical protein